MHRLGDYTIERPKADDALGMLHAHQEAFVQGYAREDGLYGATREALTEFVHGEFEERRGQHWLHEASHARTGLWIARHLPTNEVVGLSAGVEESKSVTHIDSLYVSPEHQGKGLGRELLRCTIADFVTARVRLDVVQDTAAIEFYRHLGFVITTSLLLPPEPPKEYGITLMPFEMVLRRTRKTLVLAA